MESIEHKHQRCSTLTDGQIMEWIMTRPEEFRKRGCLSHNYMMVFALLDQLDIRGFEVQRSGVYQKFFKLSACHRCRHFNGDWTEIYEALR